MSLHVMKVPDVGEGVAEVELVQWLVASGDAVAEDQPLAIVMTDKANVEIPAPVAGRVVRLGGEVGQMLAVGAELVAIETEAAVPVPATGADPTLARPLASPSVRRRARESGVDLRHVKGSGPGGRVRHEDVDRVAARRTPLAPAAPVAPAGGEGVRMSPVIGLRRRIAEATQEAWRRIPHFSYVEEVDVTELEALRAVLNDRHGEARGRLTVLPFLLRAIVLAVREHPRINARFDDEAGVLALHDAVHAGIATHTEAGLLVPVLRHAEARDLWSLAAELARLAAEARAGRASREELSGSTITVTSLGALGGIASTPVINRPEVAIVGVNRIVERPAFRGGAVVARKTMHLSSSFDHRVVDGMDAARFVRTVRGLLECPATLFLD